MSQMQSLNRSRISMWRGMVIRLMAVAMLCGLFAAVQTHSAPSAQAAVGCIDSDYRDTGRISQSPGAGYANVRNSPAYRFADGTSVIAYLRYDSVSRCVWPEVHIFGQPPVDYWWHIDRSYNGGRSWQGLLSQEHLPAGTQLNRTAFTGAPQNDAGTLSRICMNVIGYQFSCSTWW